MSYNDIFWTWELSVVPFSFALKFHANFIYFGLNSVLKDQTCTDFRHFKAENTICLKFRRTGFKKLSSFVLKSKLPFVQISDIYSSNIHLLSYDVFLCNHLFDYCTTVSTILYIPSPCKLSFSFFSEVVSSLSRWFNSVVSIQNWNENCIAVTIYYHV